MLMLKNYDFQNLKLILDIGGTRVTLDICNL